MKIRTITTGVTLQTSDEEVVKKIQAIEQLCEQLDVSFFNIGDRESGLNYENAKLAAEVCKEIAESTENGYGNFRFCASANCKPGIPFFPTGFHEGDAAFGIGLECGDLAVKAFSKSKTLIDAEKNLKEIFEDECAKVEKLGFGKFGSQGTLTISALITRVLKNLKVKTCGYSGLMLPICEDLGLATRANEETYNLSNILLYSSVCVCGCGFDTVPIPGEHLLRTNNGYNA